MNNILHLTYDVTSDDFTRAGEASSDLKSKLKKMDISPEVVRKVAISTYEGEINMVIHAEGGKIDVYISPEKITIVLKDKGPGIKDISQAMQEGWSTASENIRSLGFGAGMGLPNMNKYSDKMNIDTTVGVGTTVTMNFSLK